MTPPVPERPATPAALRERLAELDEAAVIAWLEAYLLDRVAAVMELSASRLDPATSLGALGLDSLYSVQLAHAVETGLGVELSIATLLDGPSVSELAAELAGKLVGVAEPPAPPASPVPAAAAVSASPGPGGLGAAGDEEVPLTLGQRALYFLDRLAPRGAAYVIAGAAGVRGDLDLAALRQACAALVERHPALRTTFAERGGAPVATVHPPGEPRYELGLAEVGVGTAAAGAPADAAVSDGTAADGAAAHAAVLDGTAAGRAQDGMAAPGPAEGTVAAGAAAPEALLAAAWGPFDLRRGPLLRLTVLAGPGSVVLDGAGTPGTPGARRAPDVVRDPVVVLSIHHLVADFWSLEVLIGELAALYRPAGEEAPAGLPELRPLPLTYADHARRQEAMLAGPRGKASWDFWRQELAGPLPPLELPTDRQRPRQQTFGGDAWPLRLSPETTLALRSLAAERRATPFMALLAVFQALLARLSGQREVVVGSPVSGRGSADLAGVVGYFVNPLALRADFAGDPGFAEILGATRRRVLAAFRHQDYPFPLLAERLQPRRDPGRSPLFQASFVMQKAHRPDRHGLAGFALGLPGSHLRLAGLELESVALPRRAAQFDLTLEAADEGEDVAGLLVYNTDLFDAATTARWSGFLRALAGAAAAAPAVPLAELPLLDAAERRQLLLWNDTRRAFRHGESDLAALALDELVAAQAERSPAAVAVEIDGETLTYGDLAASAASLAAALAELGVGPETIVGLAAERSLAMVVGILGILAAGAAYLPIDPGYPRERLAYMLADAAPRVLLVEQRAAAAMPLEGPPRLVLDGFAVPPPAGGDRAAPAAGHGDATSTGDGSMPAAGDGAAAAAVQATAEPAIIEAATAEPATAEAVEPAVAARRLREFREARPELGPDRLAYVFYTSGSTGKPKAAMNSHRGIVNRLLWFQELQPLTPEDRVLQKTPLSFDVSLWELFWPLVTGARLVLARPGGHLDAGYLARTLAERGITTVHFVPSMLQVFLETPDLDRCTALTRVLASGEALGFEVQERCFARLPGVALHNLYGPTETAIEVTHWQCRRGEDRRGVPIGYPIANVRIHLLDRHLRAVPPGVVGQLAIGGIAVGRGYLGRPDLTAERFVPDPFAGGLDEASPAEAEAAPPADGEPGGRLYLSGDLARYRRDGAIEYLGRIDGQVKLRGVRIELGEIESALAAHPAVAAAAVAARGEGADQRLIAYVVPRGVSPSAWAGARELEEHLRRQLPAAMVPAFFVPLPALPLTASGKVDRRALPAPEGPAAVSAAERVPPGTAVEEALAAIWCEVLKLDKVGIYDDFFALGGHSLNANQVLARVRELFEVELPVPSLFESPTIAGLAQAIARELMAEADAATLAEVMSDLGAR
jgi:amino acid adenylation domain-containing protein